MPRLTATVVRPIRTGTAEDGTPEFHQPGTVLDVTEMANREQLFSNGYLVPGGEMPELRATKPPPSATLTSEPEPQAKPEKRAPAPARTTTRAGGRRSTAAEVRARGGARRRSAAA